MLAAPLQHLQLRFATAWQRRGVTLKAASFAMVGLLNTLVDFCVFLFARELFRLPALIDLFEQAAAACQCGAPEKLALIPANIVAWSVAVSGSYVLNSLITFSAESGRQLRLKSYVSFVASGIAGLIANTTTVYVLSYYISEVAAKICAIAASFLVNFALSHFVVFRARRPQPE